MAQRCGIAGQRGQVLWGLCGGGAGCCGAVRIVLLIGAAALSAGLDCVLSCCQRQPQLPGVWHPVCSLVLGQQVCDWRLTMLFDCVQHCVRCAFREARAW